MIDATKRWLRRNRAGFAIGFGVIGIGYVAGQYVLSKVTDARERIAGERIAKENLRRRFQQNQEDCTITVLELLPTISENILQALPSENISEELQQKKAQRLGRITGISKVAPSELSLGTPSTAEDDRKSLSSLPSESYFHASQDGSSSLGNSDSKPGRTKAQLWHELKISSITRALTLLYTISLLTLLTRIQLNLLGRRNYLSSVIASMSHSSKDAKIGLENHDDDNTEQQYGHEFETNRDYLTFSWWLLHKGWRDILARVQVSVEDVFGVVNPREDVSLERLSHLILNVRRQIEGASPEERRARKWLSFILPPRDQEASILSESGMHLPPPIPAPPQDPKSTPVPSALLSPATKISPSLRRLLDETSDIIDSPMFAHVLTLLLDATFSQLVDKKLRSEDYRLSALNIEAVTEERVVEITGLDPANSTVKLVTIMAALTKEAHKIGGGVPNEYVQAMEDVTELEGFAAVVYSSNFEFESNFTTGDSPAVSLRGSVEEVPINDNPLESTHDVEVEQAIKAKTGQNLIGKASRLVDAAWEGLESVWGRVTGREDASIPG